MEVVKHTSNNKMKMAIDIKTTKTILFPFTLVNAPVSNA